MTTPYDTSSLRDQVLAALKKGGAAAEADAVATLDAARSGFLQRLMREYFEHGSIPVRLKDLSKSVFGIPTEENTLTWGDSTSALSFAAPLNAFPVPVVANPALRVMRERPTTFTTIVTVDLVSPNWAGEETTTIEIDYTIGIGQAKTTIRKIFVLGPPGPAIQQGQAIVDVQTFPLQSLVIGASLSQPAAPSNPGAHTVQLVCLAAPRVQ